MESFTIFIILGLILAVIGIFIYIGLHKDYYLTFLTSLEDKMSDLSRSTIVQQIEDDGSYMLSLADLDELGVDAFGKMETYVLFMYHFQRIYYSTLFRICLEFVERYDLLGYEFLYYFQQDPVDETLVSLFILSEQDDYPAETIEAEIADPEVVSFKEKYFTLLRSLERVLIDESYINSNNYQDYVLNENIEVTLQDFLTTTELENLEEIQPLLNEEKYEKYQTLIFELLVLFILKLGLDPSIIFDSRDNELSLKEICLISDKKISIKIR